MRRLQAVAAVFPHSILLFLLPPCPASAWVFYPGRADILDRFSWTLPIDVQVHRFVLAVQAPSQPKRRGRQDSTGLGNGITFALDPQLCPNLLPTFKEESQASVAGRLSSFGVTFVDCQEVLE